MVGGRDYGQSQFNRVVRARRQPGSAFKPFVYLAALGHGPRGEPPHFTPASLLEDRPLTIGTGRTPGPLATTRTGTRERSRCGGRSSSRSMRRRCGWRRASGYDAVVRAAREAGFTSPLEPVPALVLGSFEVTPLELAAAYAPLASGGDADPADGRARRGRPRGRRQPAARRTRARAPAGRGLPVTTSSRA